MLFDAALFRRRTAPRRASAARGAPVHALADGDITQVWMDHIGPAGSAVLLPLRASPRARLCSVLEQFALSSGLRVVFHAEHVVHADGRTHHSLLRGADRVGLFGGRI